MVVNQDRTMKMIFGGSLSPTSPISSNCSSLPHKTKRTITMTTHRLKIHCPGILMRESMFTWQLIKDTHPPVWPQATLRRNRPLASQQKRTGRVNRRKSLYRPRNSKLKKKPKAMGRYSWRIWKTKRSPQCSQSISLSRNFLSQRSKRKCINCSTKQVRAWRRQGNQKTFQNTIRAAVIRAFSKHSKSYCLNQTASNGSSKRYCSKDCHHKILPTQASSKE